MKRLLSALLVLTMFPVSTAVLAAEKNDEADIYFNNFDVLKIGDDRTSIVDSGDEKYGKVLKIVPTSSKGYMSAGPFDIEEGRDYSVSFDFKADQEDHPFKFMFRDRDLDPASSKYRDFAHISLDQYNNFVVALHGWSIWSMNGAYDNVSWSSVGSYGTDWNNINIVFHPNFDKTTIDYYINGVLVKTCDTTLGENGETAELKGETGILKTMYFLTTDTGTTEGASSAVEYDGTEAFYMDNLRVAYVDKENLTAKASFNGKSIDVKMSEPVEGFDTSDIRLIDTESRTDYTIEYAQMTGTSSLEIVPKDELLVNTEYMVILPEGIKSKSGKELFSRRLAFVVSGDSSSSTTPEIPELGRILWDNDYNDMQENLPAKWDDTWKNILLRDCTKGISTYKMTQTDGTEGIVLKYAAVSGANYLRLESGNDTFTDTADEDIVVASMDVYRDEMKRTADFALYGGGTIGLWFMDSYGNLVFINDNNNLWSTDDIDHGVGDNKYSAKHTVYNKKIETGKWYNITAVISKTDMKIHYFVDGEYVTTCPTRANWNKVFQGYRITLQSKGFTDERAIYLDNVRLYYPMAPNSDIKVTSFRLKDRNGGLYGAAEDNAPVDMRTGKIYLSGAIDGSSVDSAAIALTDYTGTNMIEGLKYNSKEKCIEFEVSDLLKKGTEYTMSVEGLLDEDRNSVPTYSASFDTTTESELVMTDYGFYRGDEKLTELEEGTATLRAVYVNTTDNSVTRELAASYSNDYVVKATEKESFIIPANCRDEYLEIDVNIASADKGILVGALLDEKGLPIEDAKIIGSHDYVKNEWSLEFSDKTSKNTKVYAEVTNPDGVVKYRGQLVSDENGEFLVNLRLETKDLSGYYELTWVDENGKQGKKQALFANDTECLDNIANINDKVASADVPESEKIDYIASLMEDKQYALNIGYKNFDAIDKSLAAEVLYSYIKDNPLNEENSAAATKVINRAVTVSAVKDGLCDNLFDNAEILELDESRIKNFYKNYYVTDAMQNSITSSLKDGNFKSFDEFYEALTEKFVLAVVKEPDGVNNVTDIIKEFSDEIGTGANGSEAAYRAVMGKTYNSYAELKSAFNKANSNDDTKNGGSTKKGGVSYIPQNNTDKNISDAAIPMPIFDDIEHVAWAKDAIVYLAEKDVINGKGGNKFCPDDKITRQEIVKLAVLAFGLKNDASVSSEFTDVSAWATEYVNSAFANKIVNGYSANVFGAQDNVTREDLVVMIYRAALASGYEFDTENNSEFADNDKISDYAVEAVGKLYNMGAINGKDNGNFAPSDTATRAEAAKIIYNVMNL